MLNGELKKGGHAVVAYGHEEGSYEIGYREYTGKILIYDPNENPDYTFDDYCLYYTADKSDWVIPAYELYSEDEEGNKIGFITDDIEIINYHDHIYNSALVTKFEHFFPILDTTKPLYSKSCNISDIKKAEYNNMIWTSIATADNYFEIPPINISDVMSNNVSYAMDDPDSGYIVELEKPEPLGFMLSYENSLMHANAVAGTEAKFAPSGCVAISGDKTDYELEIVLNDGYMVNDWYDLSVRGSGVNDAALEKSNDGYILNASNLKDVHIKAESDDATDECVISTDYPEVYIFEKAGSSIGAAVDTDNNGTYETEIETQKAAYERLDLESTTTTTTQTSATNITTTTTTSDSSSATSSTKASTVSSSTSATDSSTTSTTTASVTSSVTSSTTVSSDLKLGDVNGDNIIDGRDATDILTEYAKTSTNQKASFSKIQMTAADVNKDGAVDGRDATTVLTYYAYTSTGKKIELSEFIKNRQLN